MNDIYQSATLKLTAWYLVLLMTISLIFSGVVYHFATNTVAHSLTSQQERIYKAFPVFYGNSFFIHNDDAVNAAHIILQNLIYFNIFVLIAAGFASYWLARRTLQPIQASNERQKRFVADASHELRTPLTALKMSSEVALLDTNLSKEALRAALQSNLEDVEKLTTLLNNLLRLSKLESTEDMRQNFTRLQVEQLIEETVAETAQRANAKRVTVTNNTTSLRITGEHESLVQLMVILLDNAIKYSPEGSQVELQSTKKDHMAIVSIIDHGIGIEPNALVHVFDRFYRADKARTSKEGYGLGLSIAKHIADLHGARITLTSTPGKGTTARIMFPLETTAR